MFRNNYTKPNKIDSPFLIVDIFGNPYSKEGSFLVYQSVVWVWGVKIYPLVFQNDRKNERIVGS